MSLANCASWPAALVLSQEALKFVGFAYLFSYSYWQIVLLILHFGPFTGGLKIHGIFFSFFPIGEIKETYHHAKWTLFIANFLIQVHYCLGGLKEQQFAHTEEVFVI